MPDALDRVSTKFHYKFLKHSGRNYKYSKIHANMCVAQCGTDFVSNRGHDACHRFTL